MGFQEQTAARERFATADPRRNYSIPQATLWLGTNTSQINNLLSSGLLRSFKIGNRRYISGEALLACRKSLEERTQPPKGRSSK